MAYTRTKELLITPPAVEPVTVSEAALQCRMYGYDATHDPENLAALITTARQTIEGWCWASFITQTWQYWWDRYWWKMFIPRPPLQSVAWVKYVPPTGAPQPDPQTLLTLPDVIYELSSQHELPFLRLQYLQTWPITRGYRDDVSMQVTTGYGDSPSSVPGPIKQAIKLLIAYMKVNLGDVPSEPPTKVISLLIANYRFKEL
jgi:uncharacterized phiE125 gp8 family phage protein